MAHAEVKGVKQLGLVDIIELPCRQDFKLVSLPVVGHLIIMNAFERKKTHTRKLDGKFLDGHFDSVLLELKRK